MIARARWLWLTCAVLCIACDGTSESPMDGGGTAADARAPAGDGAVPADGSALDIDAGGASHELFIEQISILDTFSSGESALVVGPDGTSVLIDVGRPGHDSNVAEALERRLGSRAVDWLIITHYHADHLGAVDNLFAPGPNQVVVNRGVITRGLHSLGVEVADNGGFKKLCSLHESSTWSGRVFDLCSGPTPAPCDGSSAGSPWEATSCAGLTLGDLEDPSDDDAGRPSFLSLGHGARLVIYHGNGHVVQHGAVASAEDEGVAIGYGDVANENGRSLGGVIRWGAFAYVFAGDLSGAGDKDVPDVEAFIAARASGIVDGAGGPLLIPTGSADVVELSHHGLKSATQQAWVDWLFPDDGRSRNAVVGGSGVSTGYSPSGKVLDRLGPRLDTGYVWVTHPGLLAGLHDRRRDADGAVVVRVSEGGAQYQVFARTGDGPQPGETYASTP